MALALPSPSQAAQVDRAQRQAARRILGHQSSSLLPTPCMELAWQPWSARAAALRLRLLSRLSESDNLLVTALLQAGRCRQGGWAAVAALPIATSCQDDWPQGRREWHALISHWETTARQADAEALLSQCQGHPALAHYSPPITMAAGSHTSCHREDHRAPLVWRPGLAGRRPSPSFTIVAPQSLPLLPAQSGSLLDLVAAAPQLAQTGTHICACI